MDEAPENTALLTKPVVLAHLLDDIRGSWPM